MLPRLTVQFRADVASGKIERALDDGEYKTLPALAAAYGISTHAVRAIAPRLFSDARERRAKARAEEIALSRRKREHERAARLRQAEAAADKQAPRHTPKAAKPDPSTMTPADLLAWRKGHGFTQRDAAYRLGMTLRPYQYHEAGTTRGGFKIPRIPRTIELATMGLDMALRVAKLREQEGAPEPVDAEQILRVYRAAGGRDDARAAQGVA